MFLSRTVWVVSRLRSVRLENSSHNGVGPKALGGTVLGLHLLCFRSWVRVTGIQHRLEDAPASVYEPGNERQRMDEDGCEDTIRRSFVWIWCLGQQFKIKYSGIITGRTRKSHVVVHVPLMWNTVLMQELFLIFQMNAIRGGFVDWALHGPLAIGPDHVAWKVMLYERCVTGSFQSRDYYCEITRVVFSFNRQTWLEKSEHRRGKTSRHIKLTCWSAPPAGGATVPLIRSCRCSVGSSLAKAPITPSLTMIIRGVFLLHVTMSRKGLLPVVDLQKGETRLCSDLPFLVFCRVRMLKAQTHLGFETFCCVWFVWITCGGVSLEGGATNDHFPWRLSSVLSYHEMLKEPGAHDVGGLFGQDPPLILGLLVLAVQQGRQVNVYLWWRRGQI